MITFRNMRVPAIVILADSSLLAMAAASSNAARGLTPYLTRPTSAERSPDARGFMQRWLLLEPIPQSIRSSARLTDSFV
jgi:hypothetical protein